MSEFLGRPLYPYRQWCKGKFSTGKGYSLARKGELTITKIGGASFITEAEDIRFNRQLEEQGDSAYRDASEKSRAKRKTVLARKAQAQMEAAVAESKAGKKRSRKTCE